MEALSEPFDTFCDGATRYVLVTMHDEGWKRTGNGASWEPRATSDPTWRLCALLGANDDVVPAADGTIRGVETIGVALTVNLEAASTRVPGGIVIDRARSWIGRRREGRTWWLRIPALAWIDADGYVRRVSVAHLAHSAKPRAPTSWFGTDFWDFGQAPSVELPVLGSTERDIPGGMF